MAKAEKKPELIKAIYAEIEKSSNTKELKGNPNTLRQMKTGGVNLTISTLCHLLKENGIDGQLTVKHLGGTTTIKFN